jgi:hypothetical protein
MARRAAQDPDEQEEYLALDGQSRAERSPRGANGNSSEGEEYLGVDGGKHGTISTARMVMQDDGGGGLDAGGEEYMITDGSAWRAQGGHRRSPPPPLQTDGDDEEYLAMAGRSEPVLVARGVQQSSGPGIASNGDERGTQWATEQSQFVPDEEYFAITPDEELDAEYTARRAPNNLSLDNGGALTADEEYVAVKGAKSVRNHAAFDSVHSTPPVEVLPSVSGNPTLAGDNFMLADREGMEWPPSPPSEEPTDTEESDSEAETDTDGPRRPSQLLQLDPSAMGGSCVGQGGEQIAPQGAPTPAVPTQPTSGNPVRKRQPQRPSANGSDAWRMSTVARAFDDDEPAVSDNGVAAPPESAEVATDAITPAMFSLTSGHRGAAHRPSGRRLGNRLAQAFNRGKGGRAPKAPPPPPPILEEGSFVAMTDRTVQGEPALPPPPATETDTFTTLPDRKFSRRASVRSRVRTPPDSESQDNVFVPMPDRKFVRLSSRHGKAGVEREGNA